LAQAGSLSCFNPLATTPSASSGSGRWSAGAFHPGVDFVCCPQDHRHCLEMVLPRRPVPLIAFACTQGHGTCDIEDRYETRLRAMIDAKLKGEGIDVEAAPEPVATNVIDLMAALRRSIADDDKAKPKPAPQPEKAKPTKAAAPKASRRRVS
jgi:hypothetical protein